MIAALVEELNETADSLALIVAECAYRNRKKRTIGKLTIREMIEEGRRF